MIFSIIVPIYNSERFLGPCLRSLHDQHFPAADFEVIVVDDCSTDGGVALVKSFTSDMHNLRLITLEHNGGPGVARNAGIDAAYGAWVLFVDSDDELLTTALASLEGYLKARSSQALDLIGFNWSTADDVDGQFNSSRRIGRRDGHFLQNHDQLISQYLSHRMDGSVIYTAFRRDLLDKYDIRFAAGLHEDVDFIFKAFYYCAEAAYLNEVLYTKRNRAGSIVNQVSGRHIDGYFRAWKEISNFLQRVDVDRWLTLIDCYRNGSIAAIATRVREVVRHCSQDGLRGFLFRKIHIKARDLFNSTEFEQQVRGNRTVYYQIATYFMAKMSQPDLSDKQKSDSICLFVDSLRNMSWSCEDLHHSLFLRPDEIRTCCKRFFVNGERRGDVVLFPTTGTGPVLPETIRVAKATLHQKINSGEASPCDGCPFLRFSNWSALNNLSISYISLEYHSVCNLRCLYCDDDYFGGKTQSYDVQGTIEGLLATGALDKCSMVVWGGGEPVIGKLFDTMLTRIAEAISGAQHRVLTNAIQFSPELERLLSDSRAQILTSVDAGTEVTFRVVRGRPELARVCRNLKSYARINPLRVTVKYIFTCDNSTIDEVRSFVSLMDEYGLLRCNFQISYDFTLTTIEADTAMVMVVLFGMLRRAGATVVYFDELLRHRLGNAIDASDPLVIEAIGRRAGFDVLASPARYPRVILWGAGQQATYLLEGTVFFKAVKVPFLVDATPEKQGTLFHGRVVRAPDALCDCNDPVVIAAVQGYPLILEHYRALGLSEARLVLELIL